MSGPTPSLKHKGFHSSWLLVPSYGNPLFFSWTEEFPDQKLRASYLDSHGPLYQVLVHMYIPMPSDWQDRGGISALC